MNDKSLSSWFRPVLLLLLVYLFIRAIKSIHIRGILIVSVRLLNMQDCVWIVALYKELNCSFLLYICQYTWMLIVITHFLYLYLYAKWVAVVLNKICVGQAWTFGLWLEHLSREFEWYYCVIISFLVYGITGIALCMKFCEGEGKKKPLRMYWIVFLFLPHSKCLFLHWSSPWKKPWT